MVLDISLSRLLGVCFSGVVLLTGWALRVNDNVKANTHKIEKHEEKNMQHNELVYEKVSQLRRRVNRHESALYGSRAQKDGNRD